MDKVKSQTELKNEIEFQRMKLAYTHVKAIINKYKNCEEEIINCIASDTYPREKAKIIVDIGKAEEELENAIEETRDGIEKEFSKNSNNLEFENERRGEFLYNVYDILNISNFIISEITFSHKNYCLKPEYLEDENRILMEGCLSLAKEYELLRELKFELEKIEFIKKLFFDDYDDSIEADYKFYRLFDLYNKLIDLFNLLNNKKVNLKLYELEEGNIDVVNIFNALTDYSNISFT